MKKTRFVVWGCILVAALVTAFNALAAIVTTSLSYDAAGRLYRAAYSTGTNTTYAYNLAGDLVNLSVAASGTVVDSNGNGIDDAWEIQYFGTLARDGTGDFDGDGMSDLAEYLAGTNPADAASVLKITALGLTTGPQANIQWNATVGKTYRVQFKNTLAEAWQDLAGDVTAVGPSATKNDAGVSGHSLRFYRVLLLP